VQTWILVVGLLLLVPGCLQPAPHQPTTERGIIVTAGEDHRAIATHQAREFDLVSDALDPDHLSLAFVVPRNDANSPSWLAFAKSADAGQTWTVRPLCGDPLLPPTQMDPTCFFTGARLTSDPVLIQLADGSLIYVGVARRAARFERDAMAPTAVYTVTRSAFNMVDGAQMLPAPYRFYYNGKANVMQARDGALHLAWAADLVPHESRPAVGLPFWTTSRDGARTWSKPVALSDDTFGDPDALYAVGVQAFQTQDGKFHATWWESKTNALYQVSSPDGMAFTKPKKIQDAVARPANAAVDSDNLTRPWVGLDAHGSIHLLYDDLHTGDRDLYLLTSRDNATTWGPARRLDTIPLKDGRDQTMARLLVDPGGAISILYPSWQGLERWSPNEMRFAHSVDGGESFTDVLLSTAFSPLHNPGDYNALARTRDGILNVWEDGRGGPAGTKWAFQSLVTVRPES
jgi:hypothetical protein